MLSHLFPFKVFLNLTLCNFLLSEFIPCIFSSGIKEDRISTISILLSTLKTKVRVWWSHSCHVLVPVFFLAGLQSHDLVGDAGCWVGWMGNCFLSKNLVVVSNPEAYSCRSLQEEKTCYPLSPPPTPFHWLPLGGLRAENDSPFSHTHLACCVVLYNNTKCYFVSSSIFCLI